MGCCVCSLDSRPLQRLFSNSVPQIALAEVRPVVPCVAAAVRIAQSTSRCSLSELCMGQLLLVCRLSSSGMQSCLGMQLHAEMLCCLMFNHCSCDAQNKVVWKVLTCFAHSWTLIMAAKHILKLQMILIYSHNAPNDKPSM